jgi:hypothetical protein
VASFANLVAFTQREGVLTGLVTVEMAYVDRARNAIVTQALQLDATHLFWLDQDVVVPPDAVMRLLAHGEPVAAGIYRRRSEPHEMLAYELEPFRMLELPLDTTVRVPGIHMGCTLVATWVYRRLEGDWYRDSPEQGEDVWFCRRLAELGLDVLVDTSVRCGHIGTQEVAV